LIHVVRQRNLTPKKHLSSFITPPKSRCFTIGTLYDKVRAYHFRHPTIPKYRRRPLAVTDLSRLSHKPGQATAVCDCDISSTFRLLFYCPANSISYNNKQSVSISTKCGAGIATGYGLDDTGLGRSRFWDSHSL
jgi:hypothetical protein